MRRADPSPLGDPASPNGFDAIIALGSNMGDKTGNIAQAIERLTGPGDINLVKASSLYRTEPWGVAEQDWFVNACIGVSTRLDPAGLLARCLEVERAIGRERTMKWGPRIIDLDILVFGEARLSSPELTLPHPRIAERAFVLVPLAEIAPCLEIDGRRVVDMLDAIDASGVARLSS